MSASSNVKVDATTAASVILGDGIFEYEVVENWAKVPDDVRLTDVAAIAVDRRDNVYVFTRGEHPMVVFDRLGNLLRTWGHGMFHGPHGLHIGPDDSIYCTDERDHVVRKCTLEGKLLLEIGIPGKPAPFMSGKPFHRCTHTALSPNGDIYISDGYGNSNVHKYTPDGRHLITWGRSGQGPGEFYVAHNLVCDGDGWVYVADRENHRVQIFDGEGVYETQWNNLHRPCGFCMTTSSVPRFYISELGPAFHWTREFPNMGPRVSILNSRGEILARLSPGVARFEPGRFLAPHGIAVDSQDDIYVGEMSRAVWPIIFPDAAVPNMLPSLHKLRRHSAAPGIM